MSPLRRVKTKIGDLLVQKGLITHEKLKEALSLQHTTHKNKTLGQILLELGYVGKNELYAILAVQSGYPYIDLKCCLLDPKVLALVPLEVSRKYHVLPIDKIQDILTLAMVNPLDNIALEEIEEITKARVKVFLTHQKDFEEVFAKYYNGK